VRERGGRGCSARADVHRLGQIAGGAERWLHWMIGLGVAYRAISTYSRGGFLSCGVMIIVFVLQSRHKVRSMLAIGIFSFAVVSVMPQSFWDRMSTISTSQEDLAEADFSQTGRIHFWRVALRMASDHPLLGIGHNAYNAAYDRYDFSLGAYGQNRSVHSVWFGILSELGVPAFLVYLLILGCAIGGCQRVAMRAKRGVVSPSLGLFALALQTSFCVLVVGGTFVPWQYMEMLWHFVGLSNAMYVLGLETAVDLCLRRSRCRLPSIQHSVPGKRSDSLTERHDAPCSRQVFAHCR
jgi:O-antigen ligase